LNENDFIECFFCDSKLVEKDVSLFKALKTTADTKKIDAHLFDRKTFLYCE